MRLIFAPFLTDPFVLERASAHHPGTELLEKLVDPSKEPDFLKAIKQK